jgi:HPt (histidine-containing phosphotransfer) domain-containing protein
MTQTGDEHATAIGNPPIDFHGLLDRCMGNLELAERVLAKFEERFELDLLELERHLSGEDPQHVVSIAHRIKGSSANVSAEGLRQIAAEIEQLGRSQQYAEIPARMERLRHEWSRYLNQTASLPSAADAP